jgi:hypothetical protein
MKRMCSKRTQKLALVIQQRNMMTVALMFRLTPYRTYQYTRIHALLLQNTEIHTKKNQPPYNLVQICLLLTITPPHSIRPLQPPHSLPAADTAAADAERA